MDFTGGQSGEEERFTVNELVWYWCFTVAVYSVVNKIKENSFVPILSQEKTQNFYLFNKWKNKREPL